MAKEVIRILINDIEMYLSNTASKSYFEYNIAMEMEFSDFLRTCLKKDGTSLSERSIDHYCSGLAVASEDMLREGVISKPLQAMSLLELDLAIALIRVNPYFEAKDKKGKRMYSNAIKHYRLYVSSIIGDGNSAEQAMKQIEDDASLDAIERETLTKARIGQGIYRDNLLRKYHGRCIITQLSLPEILIASHIKPWAASSNKERISPDNGFLLSATYDRLFDQGLISFENDGHILLSSIITSDNAEILNLNRSRKYDILCNPTMSGFLSYHREMIFIK